MKNRNFKKSIFVVISMAATFCLYRIISMSIDDPLEEGDTPQNFNTDALANHYKLPSNLKGRVLPFHRIYEPRQVGFPADMHRKQKHTNTTKVIVYWTSWNGVEKTINYYTLQEGNRSFVRYNCPNTNCVVTRDRKNVDKADAVLFHLIDTKSSDLPSSRNSQQIWIVYNMEAPWQIKKRVYPELPKLKNVFNWTMSYRENSDVVAKYGFIASSTKSLNVSLKSKTKNVVWFVSDCQTDSKREDYVKELSKYIDVDTYGNCGDLKCFPAQSDVCYETVLQKYKFYLSFENAICKDYVTEKFFNVFNYDIVPVVFGGADYSRIVPEGTYIDATKFSEPKELATLLHKISDDENLYKNFLLKKSLFKSYLDPWTCRLCDMLHSNTKVSTLADVKKWWMKEAECITWNKLTQTFDNVT